MPDRLFDFRLNFHQWLLPAVHRGLPIGSSLFINRRSDLRRGLHKRLLLLQHDSVEPLMPGQLRLSSDHGGELNLLQLLLV